MIGEIFSTNRDLSIVGSSIGVLKNQSAIARVIENTEPLSGDMRATKSRLVTASKELLTSWAMIAAIRPRDTKFSGAQEGVLRGLAGSNVAGGSKPLD